MSGFTSSAFAVSKDRDPQRPYTMKRTGPSGVPSSSSASVYMVPPSPRPSTRPPDIKSQPSPTPRPQNLTIGSSAAMSAVTAGLRQSYTPNSVTAPSSSSSSYRPEAPTFRIRLPGHAETPALNSTASMLRGNQPQSAKIPEGLAGTDRNRRVSFVVDEILGDDGDNAGSNGNYTNGSQIADASQSYGNQDPSRSLMAREARTNDIPQASTYRKPAVQDDLGDDMYAVPQSHVNGESGMVNDGRGEESGGLLEGLEKDRTGRLYNLLPGPGGDDDLGPTLFPENYKTGGHDASFVWNCPLRSCMGLFSGKDRLDEHWKVFHGGCACLNDNQDGTFTMIGRYNHKLRPDKDSIVISRGQLHPEEPEREPRRMRKEQLSEKDIEARQGTISRLRTHDIRKRVRDARKADDETPNTTSTGAEGGEDAHQGTEEPTDWRRRSSRPHIPRVALDFGSHSSDILGPSEERRPRARRRESPTSKRSKSKSDQPEPQYGVQDPRTRCKSCASLGTNCKGGNKRKGTPCEACLRYKTKCGWDLTGMKVRWSKTAWDAYGDGGPMPNTEASNRRRARKSKSGKAEPRGRRETRSEDEEDEGAQDESVSESDESDDEPPFKRVRTRRRQMSRSAPSPAAPLRSHSEGLRRSGPPPASARNQQDHHEEHREQLLEHPRAQPREQPREASPAGILRNRRASSPPRRQRAPSPPDLEMETWEGAPGRIHVYDPLSAGRRQDVAYSLPYRMMTGELSSNGISSHVENICQGRKITLPTAAESERRCFLFEGKLRVRLPGRGEATFAMSCGSEVWILPGAECSIENRGPGVARLYITTIPQPQ